MADEFEVIRGEVRTVGYRRVSHGVYVPLLEQHSSRIYTLQNLAAWRSVLPADAVFTHVTGAALRSWWLPRLPEFVPVFVAMPEKSPRPRRAGLVCSRLRRDTQPQIRYGMPLDSAAETLLRAARDLSLFDLVIMLESALRQQDVDGKALDLITSTGRPGVVALRQARTWANPKSESAYETLLRIFHELAGIPVEPQVELYNEAGQFLARVDLLVTGTHQAHEYDGAWHDAADQRPIDRRRDRRLSQSPYVRRGFDSTDLHTYPMQLLQELDRIVGRRHDPRRLDRWLRLWAASTYSVAGRRRLRNRWLRPTGSNDWSRTA